jgi:hypothetical protein
MPARAMRMSWSPFSIRIAHRLAHTGWLYRRSEPIPSDTDFASVIESDVPIVVQHTRLDSRQAENALLSTIAFSGND